MNPWRGREILALDPTARVVRTPRLGSKPRARAVVTSSGEPTSVRCIAGEGAVVIVLDSAERIEPGRSWLLDGRPFLLLFAIDGLDASRRSRLARRLPVAVMEARTPTGSDAPVPSAASPGEAHAALLPEDVRRLARRLVAFAFGNDEPNEGTQKPGLSPAALALLEQLRRACAPESDAVSGAEASGIVPHLSALQKRRLAPVVQELLRKELVLELAHGHLIDRATFVDLAQGVRSAGEPVSAPVAAARWGCSNGRARAILDRMAQEKMVEQAQGWFSGDGSPLYE